MSISQGRKAKRQGVPMRVWTKRKLQQQQNQKQQQQRQQLKQQQQTRWMHLIRGYTLGNHIHGFYQVFWPTMRRRMRILWTLALLCALFVLVYITYLIGERHQRRRFHTVVEDSRWPIINMAFPVTIVCNKNRLNWSRLTEIRDRYNISKAQLPLLERILTAYDAVSIAHLDVFKTLQGQKLDSLNHLNFTRIVSEMTWRCEEMLEECTWQTQKRNCCDLFRPRRMFQGPCLAFNEQEQRPSAETGSGTGLVVRLILNEAQHAPANRERKGFVLVVVEPGIWSGFAISLPPYADKDVAIRAVYHFYDNDTLNLHSRQRECLHDYEEESDLYQTLMGFKYMMENCQDECYQNYMLRYCKCTFDLFFPPSNHPGCKLKDLPCLAVHNHLMQNFELPNEHSYVARNHTGMICDCLYNCKSLTLLTDVRQSMRNAWQRANEISLTHFARDNTSILVNIFYPSSFILVYRTSLVYTWTDLIVSFGAIFQLCLGCSIISLLEVCYFALFDVPRFYWTRYELRGLL